MTRHGRAALFSRPAIVAALLCAVATTPGAAAEGRYANARFGYAICVPEGLVGQGEADNGDGQRFVSDDGAELLVYGAFNALDETLASRREATVARLGPSTYRAGGRDWFVVSGRAEDRVYYVRAALRGGVFSTMELTYPAAAAPRWDALAGRLSRCFSPR
jgi:hypothetical protein